MEKEDTFETLEHFRFVLMALDTYLAGGGERYLEFAKVYSDRWLELILQNKSVLAHLFPDAESERIYKEEMSYEVNHVIGFFRSVIKVC